MTLPRPLRQLLFVVPALLGAIGCDGDNPVPGPEDFVLPPGAAAPVTMDRASYTLHPIAGGYQLTMTGSFTNTFDHPVFLEICSPGDRTPTFDIRRADTGASLLTELSLVWTCVGVSESPILWPGRTVKVPIDFAGIIQWGSDMDDVVGKFRLALNLCANDPSEAPCEKLPFDSRSSAPFTILAPP